MGSLHSTPAPPADTPRRDRSGSLSGASDPHPGGSRSRSRSRSRERESGSGRGAESGSENGAESGAELVWGRSGRGAEKGAGRPRWTPGCAPKPGAVMVVVAGNIGAGKSTILGALAEALGCRGLAVAVVPEPVDEWQRVGILERFYADPGRWCTAFQAMAFATRVAAIRRAVAARPGADVFLVERSPPFDQLFMHLQCFGGALTPTDWGCYRTWADAYLDLVPFAPADTRVLYLAPTLATAMARVDARARAGERADGKGHGVTIEYQARLKAVQEAFLFGRDAAAFPDLPACLYDPAHVVEAGPDVAGLNFRDPGPERDRVADSLADRLGF